MGFLGFQTSNEWLLGNPLPQKKVLVSRNNILKTPWPRHPLEPPCPQNSMLTLILFFWTHPRFTCHLNIV